MRRFLLATASAAALSLGAGVLARYRSRKAAAEGSVSAEEPLGFQDEARAVTRKAIQYFVVPMWLAAGLADWWCHRRTEIEDTTGLKETLIHLTMLGEAAVPVFAGFFLELDPLVLGVMVAAFFLHEGTAMWDVSYAVTARDVVPLEQHVHSFLEMVPLLAVSFVSLLHWPQLLALLGRRVEPYRPIGVKRDPLDKTYVFGALGAMATLEFLPYVEEAVRDWRAHPGKLMPPKAIAAAA
ncbi:hypothetical protein ACX40Y_05855 [Sphingomonas sp. RS6]